MCIRIPARLRVFRVIYITSVGQCRPAWSNGDGSRRFVHSYHYSAHVVALITDGSVYDKDGQPFRRRNYRPGIIAAAVLFLVTAVVWAYALSRPSPFRRPRRATPRRPRLLRQHRSWARKWPQCR